MYTVGGWFTYTPTVVSKTEPCTCGAKHTSFPTHHSDWCDTKRPPLPTSYKELKIVYVDKSSAIAVAGLMLDAKQRILYINQEFFNKLNPKEQTMMLEHEYEHYKQKIHTRINLSSLQLP